MIQSFLNKIRLSRRLNVILLFVLLGTFLSCKKESTDTESGKTATVSASFQFTSTDSWPDSYQIVLAAFNEDTTKSSSFTPLSKVADQEILSIKLEDIPTSSKRISLCLADNGTVIHTYFTYDFNGTDVTIPLQKIELLPFRRIQAQVFNAHCITCHGGSSGSPAAGMYLTAGNSFDQLVNHQAKESSKVRVMPYNKSNSFIIDVLRIKGISFEHSASRSISEENIKLLESWIQKGALK